jgi:hypothetical protein
LRSNLAIMNLSTAQRLIIVLALLTIVFWENVFQFSPRLINGPYDTTSEALVIGRLTRAAVDGLTSGNADLGTNFDPKRPDVGGIEQYKDQKRYFEDPRLVGSLDLRWHSYPSQFGLQGIFFSTIDLINPLPRKWRIGFYHLLASLMSAGALVWIADLLRGRFGWPAFCGFLIPLAIEPMFPALAPNLYWVVGIWFVPMAIAMHLADEEDSRRRFYLITAAFVFFLAKCLCGYEFVSTVIVAAAVGCLLGTKESPDRLRRTLGNVAWIVSAGVAGFAVAIFAHAAKQGGFAVIADRAASRITGDSPSLQDELILGKFVSIQSVILRYLEGNDVTLIKNFGIVLALFVLVAILALMDKKVIWYLGDDRRKLHICALAFLASFAAPLSWFVLAKAHSFDHPPMNFILWYLPTIPLGGALAGVALSQTIENRAAWATDVARGAITIAIPTVIVLTVAAIYLSDRLMQTERTWVLPIHSKGIPLFESEDLGIEFRMTDHWFTIQYDCGIAASSDGFFIRAYENEAPTNYDFTLWDRLIYAKKNRCFYAQAKADRPYSRISFGAMSKQTLIWEHRALISIPDSLTLEQVTDAEWDHGINRLSGTEFLLRADTFGQLFLKKGDHIQLASSEQRTVTGIVSDGPHDIYKRVSIDGAPVKSADVGTAPIRIIRQ